MKIKLSSVWQIFPALIFYYDFGGTFAGKAIGPLIFIKLKYIEDHGLLEHEKVHVKQAYRGLIIFHALLYRLSAEYRYRAELAAYREQLKHSAKPTQHAILYAKFISKYYRLKVTPDKAHTDLVA